MHDPLLAFRSEFPILERTTYLVSNSLGAMPRAVPERLAEYALAWAEEGGRAWARGWWDMPVRTGDEIAPLNGARLPVGPLRVRATGRAARRTDRRGSVGRRHHRGH